MMGPPRSEAELVERARTLARFDLGELADELGIRPPRDLTRDKGWVGQLLESALGASASNRAEPDFVDLGVEMKTVPVDREGRPRESTFVTAAPYRELLGAAWADSSVHHKTRKILWVPVESDPSIPLTTRRIGQALLWRPSPADDAGFAEDWSTFGRAASGGVEQLDARLGQRLQLRPKARDGRARTAATLADGSSVSARPLGFYFRRAFTEALFSKAYTVNG